MTTLSNVEVNRIAMVHTPAVAPFSQIDERNNLVLGVVLQPDTPDAQGDILPASTVAQAAQHYLHHGDMTFIQEHDGKPLPGVALHQVGIVPPDGRPLPGMAEPMPAGAMYVCAQVDDATMQKVKAGLITGFSAEGEGSVVPPDADGVEVDPAELGEEIVDEALRIAAGEAQAGAAIDEAFAAELAAQA